MIGVPSSELPPRIVTRTRGVLLALALVLPPVVTSAGTGCSSPDYECTSNSQCVNASGTLGICEASHSCSFPDDGCASRRRYAAGATSTALEDTCVALATKACVAQLAAGENHFCILDMAGAAFCWGSNEHGQLGNGQTTDSATPVRVALPSGVTFKTIYPGEESTCALSTAGDVYCWGGNADGAVGVATTWTTSEDGNDVPSFNDADVLVPTKVTTVLTAGADGKFKKGTAPKWKSLGLGGVHACAISETGAVYCWGENNHDQCGVDKELFDDPPVPIQVVMANADAVEVVIPGDEHTVALTHDGSVLAWGDNSYGQLGNGTLGGESPKPATVPITAVKQIVAGASHSCAVREDHSVWCWGYGASGALGLGNAADQPRPQRVTAAQEVATGANSFHTCAVRLEHGALDCWGQNTTGAIGVGKVNAPDSPAITIPSDSALTTVLHVAAANSSTCALTADQSLWCWGDNQHGQLGNPAIPATAVTSLPTRTAFTCGQ